jgi:hypothetical protein
MEIERSKVDLENFRCLSCGKADKGMKKRMERRVQMRE